jgi:hypothetical protein
MIDPIDRFQDAKLKIQWAKGHVYNLIDQYRAFLDADGTSLSIESDGKTGKQALKLSSPAKFPPTIALLIGDAVHNLRTAFDYVTVAITGKDWMALPVGKTRDDIVAKSTHYRAIKDTDPRLADFIIDEIQPYYRGKFMLWELSELDRIDKHRLILPTINRVHRLGIILEDESGKTLTNQSVTSKSSSGTSRVLKDGGPFKVKHEGHSGVSVSFGPGTPFNDEPVLETLGSFIELAPQAIEAFERFCFGNVANPNTIK